ncbi:MAG: ABC transporter permease [Gemmatimonadales bacterium]|nr:ABC transporter permease [Gemmatimonadales bacterium]
MLADVIAGLGRGAQGGGREVAEVTRFVGATARALGAYPATARGLWLRNIRNQVLFTAVQALPFLTILASLLGVTVVLEAQAAGLLEGFSEAIGKVFAVVVVRELGPLVTSIIVIGRSGTAIAAELATSNVLGETDAMEANGVDPLQYFVLPRVVGVALSVALLSLWFNFLCVVGGAAAASFFSGITGEEFLRSLRLAMTLRDLVITLLKGAVFGAGIAVLCSYWGLFGGRRPTDIPQSVTRGVVRSLLFTFVVTAAFALVLYG